LLTGKAQEFFRAYPYNLYLSDNFGREEIELLHKLGVGIVFSTVEHKILETNGFAKNDHEGSSAGQSFLVYTSEQPASRAYFGNLIVAKKDARAIKLAIATQKPDKTKKTVYIEASDMHKLPLRLTQGSNQANSDKDITTGIKLTYYSPDKLQYEINAKQLGMLVISNNFNHKWRATVDGAETAIIRANLAFQAIGITKLGKQSVTIEYSDPILWLSHLTIPLGFILSVCGLIGFPNQCRKHL